MWAVAREWRQFSSAANTASKSLGVGEPGRLKDLKTQRLKDEKDGSHHAGEASLILAQEATQRLRAVLQARRK